MGDGVVADLAEEAYPEMCGEGRYAWITQRIGKVMHGSDVVLAFAQQEIPWFNVPGLYFLIWRYRICYVGKSGCMGMRLNDHIREGRPIDRIAVIAGIPEWALDEFEQAYILAWNPPWNDERSRCGTLRSIPKLIEAARSLNSDAVMPMCAELPGQGALKAWKRHVLGFLANEARIPTSRRAKC